MARQRNSNRRSQNRRTLAASSAVAAFLGFGMAPLASAPAAHADDFGLDAFWDFFGVDDSGS
ncbi:hypothetical protein, partial [Mycolicibacter senuensis]